VLHGISEINYALKGSAMRTVTDLEGDVVFSRDTVLDGTVSGSARVTSGTLLKMRGTITAVVESSDLAHRLSERSYTLVHI
jgi:hypothetical protein